MDREDRVAFGSRLEEIGTAHASTGTLGRMFADDRAVLGRSVLHAVFGLDVRAAADSMVGKLVNVCREGNGRRGLGFAALPEDTAAPLAPLRLDRGLSDEAGDEVDVGDEVERGGDGRRGLHAASLVRGVRAAPPPRGAVVEEVEEDSTRVRGEETAGGALEWAVTKRATRRSRWDVHRGDESVVVEPVPHVLAGAYGGRRDSALQFVEVGVSRASTRVQGGLRPGVEASPSTSSSSSETESRLSLDTLPPPRRTLAPWTASGVLLRAAHRNHPQ
jgi:hypothetical protein